MPDEPWIGKIIGGRYRVDRKIGEGGMAYVFLAEDQNLGSKVVIKLPRPALLQEAGFAERFQFEIRALVQLSHPNVIKVTDVGQENGAPYAVMQYLGGGSLKEQRKQRHDGSYESVEPSSLSTWLPQIARALDFLHGRSFVHRDVKPQNILFDESGHAYLADFGIVKAFGDAQQQQPGAMTQTGMALGTAEYMAPEACMGVGVSGRSDQYSLAVTVYEMLAGQCPIRGTTPLAVIVQQPTAVPKPLYLVQPTIPKTLSDAVARGLEKQPENRFVSCGEFASHIINIVQATGGASEMVRRACPKCGASLKIPQAILDKSLKCPTCETSMRVISRGGDVILALKADSVPQVHLAPGPPRTPQPPPIPGRRGSSVQPRRPSPVAAQPVRRPQPPRGRPSPQRRSRRWPAVVGVLLFLAACAAVTYWFFIRTTGEARIASLQWQIEDGKPIFVLATEKTETRKVYKSTTSPRTVHYTFSFSTLSKYVPTKQDDDRWHMRQDILGAKISFAIETVRTGNKKSGFKYEYDSTKQFNQSNSAVILGRFLVQTDFEFETGLDNTTPAFSDARDYFKRLDKRSTLARGRAATLEVNEFLQTQALLLFASLPGKKYQKGQKWSHSFVFGYPRRYELSRDVEFSFKKFDGDQYDFAVNLNGRMVKCLAVTGVGGGPIRSADVIENGEGVVVFDAGAGRVTKATLTIRRKGEVFSDVNVKKVNYDWNGTRIIDTTILDSVPPEWRLADDALDAVKMPQK